MQTPHFSTGSVGLIPGGLRCCFYTCTRLSSNMPFSLSAVEVFSTCLSSVLWSMYCLSKVKSTDEENLCDACLLVRAGLWALG